MKNCTRFLLFFSLLSGISGVKAQSIAHYFVQMPVYLIPTVTVDTRKDLIDFYKNGMTASIPSAIGGEVVLKELSEDYLSFQTSENSNLQLKLLQINDTLQIITLVQTVAGPLKDSKIYFYSTLWKPLDNIVFPELSILDFMDMEKAKTLDLADRINQVGLRNFVSLKFMKNTPEVIVYSSIREDIRPEILKDFEPILRDSLTLVWVNGHFDRKNAEK